ncbi:MAG: ribosome silencing factor [Trueperaceae bacterium]|nr:ribosome silencing factor [Trueperaceae bacterium]
MSDPITAVPPKAPATPAVPAEVQAIVDALDDKRALDIAVLHLEQVSSSLDWFVVASGESVLQLQAMEAEVRERLKASGARLKGVEGPSNRWVLMDYGGVVAHLMSPEAREFYDLEGLWADAPRVPVVPS